jgi:sensor c-di-GMP phosphodiesterase-like protein
VSVVSRRRDLGDRHISGTSGATVYSARRPLAASYSALPITALKIDRSFVRDLAADPDDRILATTIVNLGHSLGLKVIAEGVETEEQRRILLGQGCDLAQGYLFGRPMPADQFVEWLGRQDTALGTSTDGTLPP